MRFLRDVVLQTYLDDVRQARRLLPDGGYERLSPIDGDGFSAQTAFLDLAREDGRS